MKLKAFNYSSISKLESNPLDSIDSKNEMSKITEAIDFCYASGKGSKKIVLVDFNQNANMKLYNDGKKGICINQSKFV